MKYTVEKNKTKHNILILSERTVITSMGRILVGKLANPVSATRYDIRVEYEVYEGAESIVDLVVYENKKDKVSETFIIDDMCLNVMSLIRVNEDVLPYIINLLSISYNGSLSDLYEELVDYYTIALEKGKKRLPSDKKALETMREFLVESKFITCN